MEFVVGTSWGGEQKEVVSRSKKESKVALAEKVEQEVAPAIVTM